MKVAAINKIEAQRTITVSVRKVTPPGQAQSHADIETWELTEEDALDLYRKLHLLVGHRTQP